MNIKKKSMSREIVFQKKCIEQGYKNSSPKTNFFLFDKITS